MNIPPSERGLIIPGIDTGNAEGQNQYAFSVLGVDGDPIRSQLVDVLVADGYTQHFRDPMGGEKVDSGRFNDYVREKLLRIVVNDPYRLRGSTATLAAELEPYYPVACARLGFGQENPKDGLFHLEAESLVEPLIGWELLKEGIPYEKTAEIGRVTVAGEYRIRKMPSDEGLEEESGLKTPVFIKGILAHSIKVFERKEIDLAVMIMQGRLLRHIAGPAEDLGVGLRGPYPMKLRWENPEAKETFRECDKYWLNQQDPPGLYVLDFRNTPGRAKNAA
ncbi:MAG TPA: hypothetical protein VM077_00590 [Candidatus Limnocylindrales bacterium]|nr:hypothetical protein [Candidatus Limnocylindrales bacterium]